MQSVHTRFLEPVDVLFLRGNQMFGDPGSYGACMLPPWPSVAAGALRSQIYADSGKILDQSNDFRLTAFHIARRVDGTIEPIYALPADLIVHLSDDSKPVLGRLQPHVPAAALSSSAPLPALPALAQDTRGKPQSGYWLTASGWHTYLDGATPAPSQLLASSDLWQFDHRVGIGLDESTRRADDGKLFSMQAVTFAPGVGFLVTVEGSASIPDKGTLRFGGDGRAVNVHAVPDDLAPISDFSGMASTRRARIVLTAPGLFPGGWKLPGMNDDGQWQLGGIRAHVVCAAIARAEVVSGWDLKKKQPKAAQRVAPVGSVYWLDDLEASPEALGKLADHGLWLEDDDNDTRRIEGYNRFQFSAYPR